MSDRAKEQAEKLYPQPDPEDKFARLEYPLDAVRQTQRGAFKQGAEWQWEAIKYVLEYHQPLAVEPSGVICTGCSTLRGQGDTLRYFPYVNYPCVTVQIIEDALKEGKERK